MFETSDAWCIREIDTLIYDVKDWDAEIATLSTELTTEEEKQSKFTKYYYRQIKMPTIENLKAAVYDNPMPKEKIIMPDEYAKRMDSDEINTIKSGYGITDDGIGYSIARVPLKGLTDEKRQFFTDNFIPEKDLFYKCWYPGMHLRHYIGGCVEDIGLGFELIYFLERVDLEGWAGIPGYKQKDPLVLEVSGGSGVSWPLFNRSNPPRHCLQGNWFRYMPDKSGIEAFITFWHGIGWKDGKAVRMIPDDEKISIDRVRSMLNHSIWEYTQVEALVNSFWEDNH